MRSLTSPHALRPAEVVVCGRIPIHPIANANPVPAPRLPAIACGSGANASGVASTAFGNNAVAAGPCSITDGNQGQVLGEDGSALETATTASGAAAQTIALGARPAASTQHPGAPPPAQRISQR